jgi:hypothetical protein
MEIAYNNNEVKKFYHKVNSIKNVFKPQSVLITDRDKEGNMLSKKEKVLQRLSAFYEKHFKLQGGTDSDNGESGLYAYKLQNHMLSHQMM